MAELQNELLSDSDLDLFTTYIKKYKAIDLTLYRKSFLSRRVRSRFYATKVNSVQDYILELKRDPQEWSHFLNALSINVSEFFRDPEVFEYLKENCLPELIDKKSEMDEKVIRCWSCGCSYGEEAYSLAILFKERLKRNNDEFLVKIKATDVEEHALEKAKIGEYAKASLAKVEKEILGKYFLSVSPDTFKVRDEIKKMVTFQKHNILTDSFFTNLDLIFFRNVKIYLSESESKLILLNLAKSLNRDGYLVLGKVETVESSLRNIFRPIETTNKIYTIKGG